MNDSRSPVVLIICDGWGVGASDPAEIERQGNAVAMAWTPVRDKLLATCPWGLLGTCGEAVGLPTGRMGNSEVGHLNLGAGRIVHQDATRISAAVRDGSFFDIPVLRDLEAALKRSGGALHLIGLCSDGGVHSDICHLWALLDWAGRSGTPVCVHAVTDGRDTSPTSGLGWIKELEARCARSRNIRIATVSGRYYAMDRDRRWARTERAYRAMAEGEGERWECASAYMARCYDEGITDEFLPPVVVAPRGRDGGSRPGGSGEPPGSGADAAHRFPEGSASPPGAAVAPGSGPGIHGGDGILIFNFRADRARQLAAALMDDGFPHFDRPRGPRSRLVAMTRYEDDFPHPVLFPPRKLGNVLGAVLSRAGRAQLRMAETEKYPHVTHFFNGGVEEPFPGEERHLVPSPPVATYDLQPEMSAPELTEALATHIAARRHDFILVNYANADMVGHTGSVPAAVTAVETVDACVGQLLEAVAGVGGTALVTADHGNAERMLCEDGSPFTAHTTFPVRLILHAPPGAASHTVRDGILADVAPTILHLMGIPRPREMTGQSLLGTVAT